MKTINRHARHAGVEAMHRTLAALGGNADIVSGLLGFLDEPVVLVDLDGNICGWSQGVEHLLGYDPVQVLGKPAIILYAEDARATYLSRFENLQPDGDPVTFETTLKTRGGELRAAQCRLTRFPVATGARGPALCRFLARGEPDSRREVSASQLRELWGLLDTVPVGFAHVDANEKLLYLNQAALRNLPGGPADVIGHHLLEVLGPDTYDKSRPERERALAGQESFSELAFMTSYGYRHFYRHLYPHRSAQGEVKGYFAVVVDITEAKVTHASLLEREHRLRAALVREINHRVKNSLQGLIGIMRLYDARRTDPAAMIDHCVSQLMAVATAFGLAGTYGKERILLTDVMRDVARSVQQLSQRRIVVELEPDAEQRPVALSGQHSVNISLVINELIFNAVKHSSPNSTGENVRIRSFRQGDAVCLQVVNTGGTLPEDFSLSSGAGLGTGLNLVKVLLPPEAGDLDISQDATSVIATLTLRAPILLKD
jgi:PAS domain S-box-containing protein